MAKSSRTAPEPPRREALRVQTGVRMEKRILLVLKALAGAHDLTLGDLLEGIVLHAFDGKPAFGASSLAKIAALREVYGLDLSAGDSHLLVDGRGSPPTGSAAGWRRGSIEAKRRGSPAR